MSNPTAKQIVAMNIRRIRLGKGWSQTELAAKMTKLSGKLSVQNDVSNWESGTQDLRIQTLARIAEALVVPMDKLVRAQKERAIST